MSRIAGRKAFDLDWVERWARQVNEDRRLPVIGRFFSGRFVLGIDDTDYLIEVSKGKVQKIAEGLAPNDFGFEFALRASSVTWGKFAQQIPPPMFNDIWAMAHPLHGKLSMEGDQKVLWQNMRAMFWAFDRMREI